MAREQFYLASRRIERTNDSGEQESQENKEYQRARELREQARGASKYKERTGRSSEQERSENIRMKRAERGREQLLRASRDHERTIESSEQLEVIGNNKVERAKQAREQD
jgi:hypothetical protein